MEELSLKAKGREMVRCAANYFYWRQHYAYSVDVPTRNESGGIKKFPKWQYLKELGCLLLTKDKILIVKERQLFVSWEVAAYVTWFAIFHYGANVALFSKSGTESAELLNKCQRIYKNLPDWMQIQVSRCNTEQLSFTHNESSIRAFTSGKYGGTGFSFSIVVNDEWDYHEYDVEGWQAIEPTINEVGRQFIGISTVDKAKATSVFQSQARQALKGESPFSLVFFGRGSRPNRDESWYKARERSVTPKEMGGLTREMFMAQNYPRCLARETLIATDEGILPISQSKHSFISGEGQLFKITTRDNRILKVTKEHQIMTPEGYKPLSDLTIGSRVSLKCPVFNKTEYEKVKLKSHFYNEFREIIIDDAWATFLGLFIGDGSVMHVGNRSRDIAQSISVVCDSQDADLLLMIEDYFDKLFGSHHTRKFSKANCFEVRKSCNNMNLLFESLEVLKVNSKRTVGKKVCVPPVIFRSPKSVIASFLRGVFETDGSISKREGHSCRITLCAKDIEFLRQVQFLLLGFGITSKISSHMATATVQGKKHSYSYNALYLRKHESSEFVKQIGFLTKRKKSIIPDMEINSRSNPPKQIILEDEIVSIEPDEIATLWDAEINPEHCFSANGIYVHNSIEEALSPAGAITVIKNDTVEYLKQMAYSPIKTIGAINIYQLPNERDKYVCANDPAAGVGHDYHASVVLNVTSGTVVADIYENGIGSREMYGLTTKMLEIYHDPLWVIESGTEWGGDLLNSAIQNRYPKLFYQDKEKEKAGQETKEYNRTEMWGACANAINDNELRTPNINGVNELQTLIYNVAKRGKMEAQRGAHDDYFSAMVLAWHARERVKKSKRFMMFNYLSGEVKRG